MNQQGKQYELQVLLDGEEALQFVEDHRMGLREPNPCVILLDLHLPKYDGIEVLRQIKRAPVLAHVHVVVMTSLASAQERAHIEQLGAFCRIKPSALSEYSELAAEIFEICQGGLKLLSSQSKGDQ